MATRTWFARAMGVLSIGILDGGVALLPAAAFEDCSIVGDPTLSSPIVLDRNTSFQLQRKVGDGNETSLTIVLSVARSANVGYLGFGIPEQSSGFMLGADVVTARLLSEGEGLAVEDRYVPWVAFPYAPYKGTYQDNTNHAVWTGVQQIFPERDCDNSGKDDWVGISAVADESCVQITLQRPYETGDFNDRDVPIGPARYIWSLGPSDNSVSYHGEGLRGSVNAELRDAPLSSPSPSPSSCPTCFSRDYMMGNFELPILDTTYVYKLFRFNDTIDLLNVPDSFVHIVGFEPVMSTNASNYLHHVVVQGCPSAEPLRAPLPGGYSLKLPDGCDPLLWVWGVGGGKTDLPPEAGMNVSLSSSAPNNYSAIYLQVHYTNAFHLSGLKDNSGIRIHFDTVPRANLAQGLYLGYASLDMPSLKPYTSFDHRQSTCPSYCTAQWPYPVNVFASFLHSHRFSQKIWTSQYAANGSYLGTPLRIDFWNFGFQSVAAVNYTISPGDRLQTHCTYDTSKWDTPVIFGQDSDQEMCLNIILFWPALPGEWVKCGAYYRKSGEYDTSCNDNIGIDGQQVDPPTMPGADPDTLEMRAVGGSCTGLPPLPPSHDPNSGYDFSVTVVGMTFSWTRLRDVDEGEDDEDQGARRRTKIKIYREGLGWIGFGLVSPRYTSGNKMIDASVVVAFPDGTCRLYHVVEASLSGLLEIPLTAANASCAVTTDGATSIKLEYEGVGIGDLSFAAVPERGGGIRRRRTTTADGSSSTSVLTEFIVARGDGTTFAQHTNQASFLADLSSNSTGTLILSSTNAAEGFRLAHVFLMTVAFGFLAPTGAFFPVFFKPRPEIDFPWFTVQKRTMAGALLTAWIGFACTVYGVQVAEGSSSHFTRVHHIVGLVVMVMLSLQPLNGFLRPAAPHEGEVKSERRALWERFHRLMGLSTITLAFVNAILGLYCHSNLLGESSQWVSYVLYVVFGIVMLLAVVLYVSLKFIVGPRYCRRSPPRRQTNDPMKLVSVASEKTASRSRTNSGVETPGGDD